ncbi:hypothetical protein ANANG_G00075990 [Anguilla anguilla]|uniref:Uncharacterized protein n=1 Tax=Anguilla anguilla TaxID=7936 RepID=A0A9D3MJ32_ANGAN|nr:hypothetical protein ANANG_G00075990 [Anguilla anguilla]
METGMESLSEKMDRLMSVQETVLGRLQDMSQDVEALRGGRDGGGGGDVTGLCREMSAIMSAVNQRSEQQSSKLEGVERLVVGIQQVIGFIGETVKSSRLMELEKPAMFDDKGRKAHKRKSLIDLLREQKGKDVKEKARSAFKGLKSQKKKKPPDADTVSLRKQALLLEEVQKLNLQNAERSGRRDTPEPQGAPSPRRGSGRRSPPPPDRLAFILGTPRAVAEPEDSEEEEEEEEAEAQEPGGLPRRRKRRRRSSASLRNRQKMEIS